MSNRAKRALAICALGLIAVTGGAIAHEPAGHSHDPAHMSQPPPHADEGGKAAPAEKIDVSPELKKILTEEMKAIQKGMQELIPAMASGDGLKVAEIGAKLEGSYIMAQKLSPKQMEELHQGLPEGFVAMDEEFHHFAGALTHAAYMKHWDMVALFYSKLTEACVNCHSAYAAEKFPGLAGKGMSHWGMAHERMGGPSMNEKCAMDKMARGAAHKHEMKDCAIGEKKCPMDAQGNCVKDKCEKAKKGECPMMKAAPEEQGKENPPSGGE